MAKWRAAAPRNTKWINDIVSHWFRIKLRGMKVRLDGGDWFFESARQQLVVRSNSTDLRRKKNRRRHRDRCFHVDRQLRPRKARSFTCSPAFSESSPSSADRDAERRRTRSKEAENENVPLLENGLAGCSFIRPAAQSVHKKSTSAAFRNAGPDGADRGALLWGSRFSFARQIAGPPWAAIGSSQSRSAVYGRATISSFTARLEWLHRGLIRFHLGSFFFYLRLFSRLFTTSKRVCRVLRPFFSPDSFFSHNFPEWMTFSSLFFSSERCP